MLDYSQKLDVLYSFYIKKMNINQIAQNYNTTWGGIDYICKRYPLSVKIIKELKSKIETGIIETYELAPFFSAPRKGKLNEQDKKEIEQICKKHFTCYMSIEDLFCHLCDKNGVGYEFIICYDTKEMDFEFLKDYVGWDYKPQIKDKDNYLRSIRIIRALKRPPKEYTYIYDNFYCGDVSYTCFYENARKYWQDDAMDYWKEIISQKITLGKYLDENYYYDDDEKKIKKYSDED